MTSEIIRWEKIEQIMNRSIRNGGGALSIDEQQLLEEAFASDSKRYSDLHTRLKLEADREVAFR